MTGMIDLHVHSRFSDGTDSPDELVGRARRLGLRALALTDHDNTRGVKAFLAACRTRRLSGIAGIEVSIDAAPGTLHLIGLGMDPDDTELNEALDRVLDGRDWRNRRILEKLQALGLALTWEEVAGLAGTAVVGRPHFAQAMIARGWVQTTQEAFDRYLAKGAPAYVDRYRLTPAEAIRLIRGAGGVAVLAHPFTWRGDPAQLEAGLGDLMAAGLNGIEAYYASHTVEETISLLRLAEQRNLLVAGGSDYHGLAVKPDTELGSGTGRLHMPDSLLEPLFAAIGPSGHYHREAGR